MRVGADQPKTNLTWDGMSVWWPASDRVEKISGGDSNLWMCAQDLGTEIWAQLRVLEQREKQDKLESIRLENCSADLQKILIQCLPFNEFEYRRDLVGAVSNFTKLVAQELLLEGRLVFEVRKGIDRSLSLPRLERAALVLIPRKSVIRFANLYFQVVPPGVEPERPMGRVIQLDRARLAVFAPPNHWRRHLARIRNGLPTFGRSADAWIARFGQHKVRENFRDVNFSYCVQRARLTAPIGWNARGLFQEHIADFHWAARQLRWQLFCIEIRDAIFTTLGNAFALIGSWKGECPKLVWDNLPTRQLVEERENQLMGSGAPFDEILKRETS